MPRNPGTGVYTKPSPDVITGTTIESTVYNTFVGDVETDLNLPRPIIAGGTGANNALQARDNLDCEVATQVVTNYDSHVFEAGSFKSAIGATGAPTSTENFSGICYLFDATSMFLEGRAYEGSNARYFRMKHGGIWDAWKSDLTVAGTNQAFLFLNRDIAGVNAAGIQSSVANVARWALHLGSAEPETGGQAGSNFGLIRCADNGSVIDNTFSIARATGAATFSGTIKVSQNFASSAANAILSAEGGNVVLRPNGPVSATGQFGVAADGSVSASGGISATGGVSAGGAITTSSGGITATRNDGAYQYTLNSTAVRSWGLAVLASGAFAIDDISGGASRLQIDIAGAVRAGVGVQNRAGNGGSYSASVFNLFYAGGPTQLWIDASNLGNITVTSDYRIKKDVLDLPGMWDTVKALRPIKYTQAEFSTPSHLVHIAQMKANKNEVSEGPLFPADDIERWGFIAHELQATLVPSAATGEKDSPDTVQSPNPFTLIAALTKALQEAMARIEALEAAAATP